MKIATLYKRDGKIILETDNDAIAKVATDTPQDVIVAPPTLAAPFGIDVVREISNELRTRHVRGCGGPSRTLVNFANRLDAAIAQCEQDSALCDRQRDGAARWIK